MTFTFDWSAESIKSCLYQQDRFLRWDFTKGFEADPLRDAVLIDPARNLYATPVSNNRYLMIWQHEPETSVIKLGYVVAKSYRGETPEELKEKLERIISIRSDGHYTLDNLLTGISQKNTQKNSPTVQSVAPKKGLNL